MLDLFDNKFSNWDFRSDPNELVMVLSNLAVRKDKRKKGYAKELVYLCEDFALVNIYAQYICDEMF